MTEHRDTTVADALRRLDVPDHDPGFWDQLEARLTAPESTGNADPASADPDTHSDVIELDSAPSYQHRLARARRPMLAMVAAVAAVAALVVGASVLRPASDDESQVDIAHDVDPMPAPEDRTADEQPVDAAAAEATAVEWLARLSDGDIEGAHAQLDTASQKALPMEEFRGLASGLAEGAAAFEGVETRYVAEVDVDGRTARVVTFVGEVEREGMVETDAFPVVIVSEDGELRVAFEVTQLRVQFATAPAVEIEAAPGATVFASVDGGAVTTVRVDDEGHGSLMPDVSNSDPWSVLTIVAVTDGRPTARAGLVPATGGLEITELPLQPADFLTDPTVLEEDVDGLIGAYSVRATPGGNGGLCFEVETGDGVFGGPCLGTAGFGELVTPEGTRILVGLIREPEARSVVVTVDGEDRSVQLTQIGDSAASFALRIEGDVHSASVLDGAGGVIATEAR